MAFRPENIPQMNKDLQQWDCYKLEVVDGNKTKVPYNPATSQRASSTNPLSWVPFTVAEAAYRDLEIYDGVCFFVTKESGLVFIDLDNSIINGTIEPWAMDIVKQFSSYTEISQSGNGLHILINGTKPGPRCRRAAYPHKVEIYDHARQACITGDVLEGHSTIEARQAALDKLYHEIFGEEQPQQATAAPGRSYLSDEGVLLKARTAKNGADFEALWKGSLLGYNGDESAADQALMNRLAFWCGGDKGQMERLFSASALGQRGKWRNRPGYRESTINKALKGRCDFYEPRQAKRTSEDALNKIIQSIDSEELTEGGNAKRLERICGGDMRYNHTHKKWLLWDGGRWKIDTNGGAMRLAAGVVAALYLAASKADGKDEREALAAFAQETDSRKGLSNMLALAANRLKFALTADDFDRDPWLLGAGDVTIDLKTGSPREPRREDLITKAIGARYDRTAQCPLWLKFMKRTFPDEALRKYIQRAVGYCLTGSMGEQIFFFCYGMGANGKSVFLAVLRALLGEYARMADFSAFLVQRNEKVRNDLAALAGARVITAIESEEGGKLSMQVIKSWTGGDPITARFLFGEYFTFNPTGKLWLAANNKPAITERNRAAWRRPRLIPYTATIPEAERVGEYEKVLYPELPGILNWALEGLQDYLQNGLQTPKAVLDATAEYRKENDSLEQFVSECCEIGKLKACKNTDLYSTYLDFCGMSGLKALSQTKFSIELKTREGISSTRSPAGITWLGIALKTAWCRVGANPTSITSGSNDVGFEENAQSPPKPPLREDFAQNGINLTSDNDSNPTSLHKEPFYVDNEGGIRPHPRKEETTLTDTKSNEGFEKFKAGMKKRQCCLCGRTFPYDLSPYYNDGKSGHICTSCHMGHTEEPAKADPQTKLEQAGTA